MPSTEAKSSAASRPTNRISTRSAACFASTTSFCSPSSTRPCCVIVKPSSKRFPVRLPRPAERSCWRPSPAVLSAVSACGRLRFPAGTRPPSAAACGFPTPRAAVPWAARCFGKRSSWLGRRATARFISTASPEPWPRPTGCISSSASCRLHLTNRSRFPTSAISGLHSTRAAAP